MNSGPYPYFTLGTVVKYALSSFLCFCGSMLFFALYIFLCQCTAMSVQVAVLIFWLFIFWHQDNWLATTPLFTHTHTQLLALCNKQLLSVERLDIPVEIRRRRRGCRAGVKRHKRNRQYKPCLPSVIMGNVRSLPNKLEELTSQTRLYTEYRQRSIMCFAET